MSISKIIQFDQIQRVISQFNTLLGLNVWCVLLNIESNVRYFNVTWTCPSHVSFHSLTLADITRARCSTQKLNTTSERNDLKLFFSDSDGIRAGAGKTPSDQNYAWNYFFRFGSFFIKINTFNRLTAWITHTIR